MYSVLLESLSARGVYGLRQNFTAPEYLGRVMAVWAMTSQGLAVSWLDGESLLDVIAIFPTARGGAWTVLVVAMLASKGLRSS